MIDNFRDRFLQKQQKDGLYQWQRTEFHFITTEPGLNTSVHLFVDDNESTPLEKPFTAAQASLHSGASTPSSSSTPSTSSNSHIPSAKGALTSCVFQKTRPNHKGARPDILPFKDIHSLRDVFDGLGLPDSYFQVADGSPTSCHGHALRGSSGSGIRYIFAGHWVTKKGDWALALSHEKLTRQTSIFWSMDKRMDSDRLMKNLQNFHDDSFHPMIVPCIMFNHTFQMSKERRNEVKRELTAIETEAEKVYGFYNQNLPSGAPDEDARISKLFQDLQNCRNIQESQEGRRQLWQSFYKAIDEGLSYTNEEVVNQSDQHQVKVHADLQLGAAVTWNMMQNLLAREDETIRRTDNAAGLIRDIVQLRENRLQATIAWASKRDSEDMKFIALLGSVFVPASFIATVLNIPAFQFLRGAKLFGAYIGITLPLVFLVIVLCVTRARWKQLPDKFSGDSKGDESFCLPRFQIRKQQRPGGK